MLLLDTGFVRATLMLESLNSFHTSLSDMVYNSPSVVLSAILTFRLSTSGSG